MTVDHHRQIIETLTAERDALQHAFDAALDAGLIMKAQRDALQAAIDKVLALHPVWVEFGFERCGCCKSYWPCETVKVLTQGEAQ